MKNKFLFLIVAAFSVVGIVLLLRIQHQRQSIVQAPVTSQPAVSVKSETTKTPASPSADAITANLPPARPARIFSARVQQIADENLSFADRINSARQFKNPDAEEVDALISYITEPRTEDAKGSAHELKNEIMNLLARDQDAWSKADSAFIAAYENRSQNVVIRDYALQHVKELYEGLATSENPTPDTGASLKRLEAALWSALSETDSSIAGTALLSLNQLAESNPNIEAQRLDKAAITILADSNAINLSRIAALQVCGTRKVKEALPVALRILDTETDTSLRIAAIFTIGHLGGTAEAQKLEQLLKTDQQRLVFATKAALANLLVTTSH